jgi:hypothetical protein
MELGDFVKGQAKALSDIMAAQYVVAYNKGIAAKLRQQDLAMIKNTAQPTMMHGAGSKVNAQPLGFTDNVDYESLVTGGKVNRKKKANKWLDFSSKAIDVALDKAEKAKQLAGAGKKSGKISRKKKADQWLDFSSKAIDLGLEKGEKAKHLAGAGAPRRPSAWVIHVKAYAANHGVSYKDAMSAARATYKKM